MIQDNIIHALERLRTIEPDSAFAKKTRLLVFRGSEPKRSTFEMPLFRFSSGILVFGALVLVISYLLIPTQNNIAAALNTETLSNEFNGMNINVELKEIQYQQSSNQTITSALHEITDNRTKHLNQGLIESEQNSIASSPKTNTNQQIDDLLSQVLK